MKKRQLFKSARDFVNTKVGSQVLCLNCLTPLSGRRTRYCSTNCSDEFFEKHHHRSLRGKLIRQKDSKCDACHTQFPSEKLILDHIKPIAIDGDEFDEENLQILCEECNKAKTRKDMGTIAKARKIERFLSNNQTQLVKEE